MSTPYFSMPPNANQLKATVVEDTTVIISNDTCGAPHVQVNAPSLNTAELITLLNSLNRTPGIYVMRPYC